MADVEAPADHHNTGPSHTLERLVFFSDAVFAIAITLLVIEIHVPEVARPRTDLAYLAAASTVIPNFIGFFISFFVIGGFWAGHHRTFACARHWSQKLTLPNLTLLSTIAAMPFFTAFASEHYGQRVPTMLYCFWLVLTALANMLLQRVALAPPVLAEEIGPGHVAMLKSRGRSVLLGSISALVVGYFVPILGQPTLMTIPLWRILLQRRLKRLQP